MKLEHGELCVHLGTDYKDSVSNLNGWGKNATNNKKSILTVAKVKKKILVKL